LGCQGGGLLQKKKKRHFERGEGTTNRGGTARLRGRGLGGGGVGSKLAFGREGGGGVIPTNFF